MSMDVIKMKITLLSRLRKLDSIDLKWLSLNTNFKYNNNVDNDDITREFAYFLFERYPKSVINNVIEFPYSVFFSYKWEEKSINIVEKIESAFKLNFIKTVRDKEDLKYGDSVVNFMKEIGLSKYVIVIISNNYFRSEFCMFELMQVYENNVFDHLLPVILPNSMLTNKTIIQSHINYWKSKMNNSLKTGEGDIVLYAKIVDNIEDIIDKIRDIKIEDLDKIEKENFKDLIDLIKRNK